MARKPKAAPPVEPQETPQVPERPEPGTTVVLEDGRTKTFHKYGLVSIDS